jgi:hypothetical protein
VNPMAVGRAARQKIAIHYLPYASKKERDINGGLQWRSNKRKKMDGEEMNVNFNFFPRGINQLPISISVGQDFSCESLMIEQRQYEMITKDPLSTCTYAENQDGEGIEELEDLQFERQDQDEVNLQELSQVHLDDLDDEDW